MKAVHAGGGRRQSNDEVIRFLESPPALLNGTESLPPGKRGPRTRRTWYDLQYERSKAIYHLLKRLPDARRQTGLPLLDRVRQAYLDEMENHPDAPKRTMNRRIQMALELRGYHHDISTIRRARKLLDRQNHPK